MLVQSVGQLGMSENENWMRFTQKHYLDFHSLQVTIILRGSALVYIWFSFMWLDRQSIYLLP